MRNDNARTGAGAGAFGSPVTGHPHDATAPLTFERARQAAAGAWHRILPALGIDAATLRDRHGPCPGCGGHDRFRFDDRDGTGTWLCSGGGDLRSGDGFDLLAHVYDWTHRQVLHEVAMVLGMATGTSQRASNSHRPRPAPAPRASTWHAELPVPQAAAEAYQAMRHPALGKPTRWWRYETADRELLYCVARFETPEGKAVRPASFGTDGTSPPWWRWKRPHVLVPWNLPQLYIHTKLPVALTEGEKAAQAAVVLLPDYVATCGHGGAAQAHLTHWGHLARRDVLVLPDDDEASITSWAPEISSILLDEGARVRVAPPAAIWGADGADLDGEAAA